MPACILCGAQCTEGKGKKRTRTPRLRRGRGQRPLRQKPICTHHGVELAWGPWSRGGCNCRQWRRAAHRWPTYMTASRRRSSGWRSDVRTARTSAAGAREVTEPGRRLRKCAVPGQRAIAWLSESTAPQRVHGRPSRSLAAEPSHCWPQRRRVHAEIAHAGKPGMSCKGRCDTVAYKARQELAELPGSANACTWRWVATRVMRARRSRANSRALVARDPGGMLSVGTGRPWVSRAVRVSLIHCDGRTRRAAKRPCGPQSRRAHKQARRRSTVRPASSHRRSPQAATAAPGARLGQPNHRLIHAACERAKWHVGHAHVRAPGWPKCGAARNSAP